MNPVKLILKTNDGEYTCFVQPGTTLLEAIRTALPPAEQSRVPTPCGGRGTCGKCRVLVLAADGQKQELLACRTEVLPGMRVVLPEQAAPAVEGTEVCTDGAGAEACGPCGIACDVGTTTVVCRLMDISTGKTLGILGEANRQAPYGADVISRIRGYMDGHGAALTQVIRDQLRDMILVLCREAGILPRQITAMTVAGNTTMEHLLAGLSPETIGRAPYTPVSLFDCSVPAGTLELPFDGTVYLLPAVSGYVGGDITGDLLAAEADRQSKPMLLIDVGTNGEMAIGCGQRFLCCATAAGPAFEGAEITCGMTASDGAITAVRWEDGAPVCTVAGGGRPKGICGSGLIDAAAMLLELGVLDETGRMWDPEEDDEEELPPEVLPYMLLVEAAPAFSLAEGVFITQGDVRKMQLGKAAIAAGAALLRERFRVEGGGEAAGLILAGGFGSRINPVSAARIGLIPEDMLPVTRAAGNLALAGAELALTQQPAKQRLTALQGAMEYIELSCLEEFNTRYIDEMYFPEKR